MSRTVAGEALFGEIEKEVFRKMIWQVAVFSGVRVVTYAVMKNHFHILAEVPSKDTVISDGELVRRYRTLYPRPTSWQPMRVEVLEKHLKDNTLTGQQLRRELLNRMHDVSWFMKTLKQRFTHWFNGSRERFGALWAERYKSVLVEGDQWALRTVAAYIDLNAVRAGLVADPKDYRFCGYGEAVAGRKPAKEGLKLVGKDLAGYRRTLFGTGTEAREGKCTLSRDDATRVLEKEKGELPLATVLRCRVRYFSDGMIIGSAKFVEEQLRHESSTPQKSTAPHPMNGTDWGGLTVARGLRKKLFQ